MLKKSGRKKTNVKSKKYLVVSAFAGITAWIIGELLFEGLTEKLPAPFGIVLYFLLFFVILFVALFVLLNSKLTAAEFKCKKKQIGLIFLVILLVFSLLTGLFEFLYELGKNDILEPTSLIFLIDDSGSMSGNEADRTKALNDVMKNNKLPFAVYSFTNDAAQLRNMGIYDTELTEKDLGFSSYGGTAIIRSIKSVLNELEQGNISNAGLSPKILLVSDGDSSKHGLRSMAKECRRQKVSISSIGMVGSSESLLKSIAEATGGVYVKCTDITSLGDDLTKAVASDTDRNLLSERVVYNNDALYAVLRILFLSLMGVLWSVMKNMMISEEKNISTKVLIASVAACVVGALVMEFGTSFGVPIALLRLIFDVLWAVTYGTFPKKRKRSGDGTGSGKVNIKEGSAEIPPINIIGGETPQSESKLFQLDPTKQAEENFVQKTTGNRFFDKVDNNGGSGVFGSKNGNGGNNASGVFGSKSGNGESNGSGKFGMFDGQNAKDASDIFGNKNV